MHIRLLADTLTVINHIPGEVAQPYSRVSEWMLLYVGEAYPAE
jgi:hypothetical protein